MSRILNAASVAAVGLTVAATLLLAEPGFASDLGADANAPVILLPGTEPAMKAETADLSTDAPVAPLADTPPASIEPATAEPEPVSLAPPVDATPLPAHNPPTLGSLACAAIFDRRRDALAAHRWVS